MGKILNITSNIQIKKQWDPIITKLFNPTTTKKTLRPLGANQTKES